MATSSGILASTLCAPIIDGPEQVLRPIHRNHVSCQLADDSGRVVMCVTNPAAVRLPYAVVVASLPSASSPVSVGDGTLGWDGWRARISRWWQPSRPHLPGLRARLDDRAIGDFTSSWKLDIGSGEGLTPYADDIVCGALTVLRAAGHPLGDQIALELAGIDLEGRTTATSASLLRLAAAGYCIDQVANYLSHLATGLGQTDDVEKALLDVGHSSGRGLRTGVNRLMHRQHEGVAA